MDTDGNLPPRQARPALDTYAICRRGRGKEIDRYPGLDMFESLAQPLCKPRDGGRLLVTLTPGDKKPAPVTHSWAGV